MSNNVGKTVITLWTSKRPLFIVKTWENVNKQLLNKENKYCTWQATKSGASTAIIVIWSFTEKPHNANKTWTLLSHPTFHANFNNIGLCWNHSQIVIMSQSWYYSKIFSWLNRFGEKLEVAFYSIRALHDSTMPHLTLVKEISQEDSSYLIKKSHLFLLLSDI